MGRLWRKNPLIKGFKYLVKRRDGTVPEWSWFVLGARDRAAHAALIEYANEAERLGYNPEYVDDVRKLVFEFIEEFTQDGKGDPDAGPHRPDDPAIIAEMMKHPSLNK